MEQLDQAVQQILALADEVLGIGLVDPADIPRIALYMEQVTSFFEEELSGARRHDDEKLLTKTMINNYTKEGTLPRPDGKKYNRNHIIRLMVIFLLKYELSMQDIKATFDTFAGDDAEQEAAYQAYLELLGDYRAKYRADLQARLASITDKMREHNIHSEQTFNLLLVMLTATQSVANKHLIWRLLDAQHPKKEPTKKEPI